MRTPSLLHTKAWESMGFHLKAFEFTTTLFIEVPCIFCTLQTMHPSLGPPSHLFSLLLIPKRQQKQEQLTKETFLYEKSACSACRNGALKHQPNKIGMTPQQFHILPKSCAKTTCKLLYLHLIKNQTKHSPMLTLQPSAYKISATFSCNKISQHNLHSNILFRLSTACALYNFCMQDRPYLPCSV